MCQVLQISRSSYYYEVTIKRNHTELVTLIMDIFKSSHNNYGTRKIKAQLKKEHNLTMSRRYIGEIMKQQGMVSNYTVAQFKPHKITCNESEIANVLDRQFDQEEAYHVVVSDLTDVRVGDKWNYICVLIDLSNRALIGYSAGRYKDASLVMQAFYKVEQDLSKIQLFHTDRGREFKNQIIDELLETFNIQRS